MKKIVSIVCAVTLVVTGLALATTATVANADVQQYDEFYWTATNADGTIGEVFIQEVFFDEEQTTEFYELALGIPGITGQEAFIYVVTNINWMPISGVNGFSGFNIPNQYGVDTVGNAFGPPGWEAFAGYSGINTPPNPDNFEWDVRDDVGMGLMPGETGLFGFTVAADMYMDVHYGPGSWMHSWLDASAADVTMQEDISGPAPDVTAPEVACLETVNPHGKNVPPAGRTTLPGPKGGQNEDGFYELLAWDDVDSNPDIYVVDTGSGVVFGPFASGDKIKYTEDLYAIPEMKKMGSNKGKAGAIAAHIIGNGDAAVAAVDASGNMGWAICYVPPVPK